MSFMLFMVYPSSNTASEQGRQRNTSSMAELLSQQRVKRKRRDIERVGNGVGKRLMSLYRIVEKCRP